MSVSNLKISLAVCRYVLIAVLAIRLPTVAGADRGQADKRGGAVERPQFQLPKMFDFEHYKRIYGKTYGSPAEESARKNYFLARAFRAYLSGIKYKSRQSDYYLALNHLSDRSQEERERRRNKALMESSVRASAGSSLPLAQDNPFPELTLHEGEDVEEAVRKQLARHVQAFSRERSSNKAESRRSASGLALGRDLSMGDLIKSPGRSKTTNQSIRRKEDVQSSDEFTAALESLGGSSRELEDVPVFAFESSRNERPLREQLANSISSGGSGAPADLHDAIFFDHRQHGCLTEVRDQGNCGSCYAFSAIAMAEWHYCRATRAHGNPLEFTEQYLLDCGWRLPGMSGCDGSNHDNVARFIHNFGLERRRFYPYMATEFQCPYPDHVDLDKTGYVRMPLDETLRIPVSRWHRYIANAPLYVNLAMGPSFDDFGGGVHDGQDCPGVPNHAMVLVGHGREDGREYWLFRNSYGITWAEQGYFKLAKLAPERCIYDSVGFSYGTMDGVNFNFWTFLNDEYDPKYVSRAQRGREPAPPARGRSHPRSTITFT